MWAYCVPGGVLEYALAPLPSDCAPQALLHPADAGSPLMPKCGPEGSGPLGWRGLLQGPGLHAMSVPTGGSQGSKGSADRLGRAVI